VYNRAIILEQLGRIPESVAEFRRYLQLTPSEVDSTVVDVSARIGMLEGVLAAPTPSPGSALALGVLFPGMGQYYSGRNRAGTVVLGVAAAAIVAGIVVKEVTIQCTAPVGPGEDCPPGMVHAETTRRPILGPALIGTGVVAIGAAVEAYVRARRARNEQAEALGATSASTRGARIVGPSITASRGRVDLSFLQLRFR
jgi:hypothetical protein